MEKNGTLKSPAVSENPACGASPTGKPEWLKVRLPSGDRYKKVRSSLSARGLHTVCEEARCPNLGECWNAGTATFMILGDTCTRGCGFCAVKRGSPDVETGAGEARLVAEAASAMGLDYVVVTSVTRDDLADGGAGVFAETVRRLKELPSPPKVELLIPDYLGDSLEKVLDAGPDVLAHNIEVVERLTALHRHPRFSYRRSLEVLRHASGRGFTAKSSIMLGLGETEEEIQTAMADLLDAGAGILALGQYLRPSASNSRVMEYVPPEKFHRLAALARAMGFAFVSAGPLVRTSYRAAEAVTGRASG